MDNIRYHEVQPSNDQAAFKEFNSIDFEFPNPINLEYKMCFFFKEFKNLDDK